SAGLAWILFMLASIAASALAIILLTPRFVERSRAVATGKPLVVALVGFAALFGAPMLAVTLGVTLVLIPLGLLVFALWLAAMLVSQALFAYFLGSLFMRQQSNIFVRAFAGVVVLVALYLIPLVNALVAIVSLVFGMGMVIMTVLNGYKRPNYTIEDTSKKPVRK